MISSLLGGTMKIEDLFSPNLESFSLFSSSTDASGNPTAPTTDASGNGMFGNTFSLFSSSSTDASGNPTRQRQRQRQMVLLPTIPIRIRRLRHMLLFLRVYSFCLFRFAYWDIWVRRF